MLAEDIRHPEAAHCLQKEVRKNIKIKKETKEVGTETVLEGGLKKQISFQTPGNTLTGESVVSLGTSEGNITRRKNK